MTAGRKKRVWRGTRGALRQNSKVRAVHGKPAFRALLPLLEFVPPSPPPAGLLAQIESRIVAIDRAQTSAEARAARVKSVWRILGAGLAGALMAAAAMAALLLGGPDGIRP